MFNSHSDHFIDLYGGGRCSSSRLLARQWRTPVKTSRASTAYRLNCASARSHENLAASRHRAVTASSAPFSLPSRRVQTPASSAATHRRQSAGAHRAAQDAFELARNTLTGSERKTTLACIAYSTPIPGPSSKVFFLPPRSALTFRRRGNAAQHNTLHLCYAR